MFALFPGDIGTRHCAREDWLTTTVGTLTARINRITCEYTVEEIRKEGKYRCTRELWEAEYSSHHQALHAIGKTLSCLPVNSALAELEASS